MKNLCPSITKVKCLGVWYFFGVKLFLKELTELQSLTSFGSLFQALIVEGKKE